MTTHATSRFVLPTIDTIVGGVSAAGSANPWAGKRASELEEPTRGALSDLEQPWLRSVLHEMGAIANLDKDWDGYGAGQVRTDVLWYALRLLQSVMENFSAPQVTPMSHEGILLEWVSDGARLEIEIEDAGEAHISYEDEISGINKSWELRSDFRSLLEPLRSIAGQSRASPLAPS